MRIGYLTYGLDRAPTGIGRYSIELLRAIARQPGDHEIVLLSTEREDRHGLWGAFEHHALRGCQRLPALMSIGNLLIDDAIRRCRLDVIHDPNGIAPFLGPAAAARKVVTIHDAFAYVQPETHNWLDNWRYRFMLPQAARRADAVITDSQQSLRDLQRYLAVSPSRLRVISCGVDPQFRPLIDDPGRRATLSRYGIDWPYVLYVGGINARKNLARLLEAFERVIRYDGQVKLVIAGKRQWHTGAIDDIFNRLNLEQRVHFTGYVDDADLPALYSAADLFVFPSLYEGFGLPPLEAMACGTPVVTSNVSSLPEVVSDAAVTIDPYDVGALASAITRALSDSELRAALRQRGFQRAAMFTWERAARATLEVYQQVLARQIRAAARTCERE